jgi:hypothetical protein
MKLTPQACCSLKDNTFDFLISYVSWELVDIMSLPFASGNVTETQDTEVCIMACPKSLWVTVIKGHDHLHSCLVSLGFTGTERLGTFKVSLWTFFTATSLTWHLIWKLSFLCFFWSQESHSEHWEEEVLNLRNALLKVRMS